MCSHTAPLSDRFCTVPSPGRWLVHVGFACNNRCVFCAQGDLRQVQASRSRDDIMASLQTALERGFEAVAFVGGEPTLREDLPDLIRDARKLGIHSPLLQTNGRMLSTQGYAKRLLEAGLEAVDVSLQGSTDASHDYHTCTPDSWRQTLRGVHEAKRVGLRVGMSTVVSRSNFRRLPDIGRLVSRARADAWHLAFPRSRGRCDDLFPSVVPRFPMLAPVLRRSAEACKGTHLRVVVSGAPLCVVPGFEASALEWHVDAAAHHRAYGPVCVPCPLRSTCPGLDQRYADAYGFAELRVPRTSAEDLRRQSQASHGVAGLFAGVGVIAT